MHDAAGRELTRVAREQGADRLVPVPLDGRVFRSERIVRFGDVSPAGRARFDALARYLQDVSNDDTTDAGLADDVAWVVRRTVMEVHRPAVFRERLALATFCGGLGSRWAERRISLRGDAGAVIEAATLWVHVDAAGRPAPLDRQFLELYGPAAADREVTARLSLPASVPERAHRRPWQLRFADFDALRHVNNAVAWAMVEEAVAAADDGRGPCRVELEYRGPIERGDELELCWDRTDAGLLVWGADRTSSSVPLAGRVRRLTAA